MRTIIFVTTIAILAISCTNPSQPNIYPAAPTDPDIQGHPPNPAQQGSAFSISTEAFYQGSLKPASAIERIISLKLTPTHEAMMKTTPEDNSRTIIDVGEWSTLENGNLRLNLQSMGGKDSVALEFKTDGNKLIYEGSDQALMGLILWVKPVPEQ